ncbi:MAG: serine/threonine-protein kinase, partial [Myxococcota bacterium]
MNDDTGRDAASDSVETVLDRPVRGATEIVDNMATPQLDSSAATPSTAGTGGGLIVPQRRRTLGPLARGTAVGRYLITGQLGVGGMGVVYEAYDPELHRQVALKLLRVGRRASTRARARLLREAQALARVSHPNVITIYDIGEYHRDVFIAVERVVGVTLEQWLAAAARDHREILDNFIQAGRGLAAAHAAGIVHRDFKPQNVLVGDDGRVRVVDFGIARAFDADTGSNEVIADDTDTASPSAHDPPAARHRPGTDAPTDIEPSTTIGTIAPTGESNIALTGRGQVLDAALTMAGTVVGTPMYMSPEQHRSDRVDARTDQFSLCVALYKALYKQWPFRARTREALELAVNDGKIVKVPAHSEVPTRIEQCIGRGLSADPGKRYPSMGALLDDLAHDPAARRRRLTLMTVATAAVAVAVVSAVIAFGAVARSEPCRGAERKLVGVWDESARSSVSAAFMATGRGNAGAISERVATALDSYTERWVTERTASCRATRIDKEQSETVLDRHILCLDRQLAKTRALVTLFGDQPTAEVVDSAVQAVLELPRPGDCAAEAASPDRVALPGDPAQRRRIAELTEEFDRVEALSRSGQFKIALPRAQALTRASAAVDYPLLYAQALLVLG